MTNDTTTAVLDKLAKEPRSTANELGRTIADMNVLAERGLIVKYGTRRTGKRGKPPIEWVLAGTVVSDTQAEAVGDAVAVVDNYNEWMASSNKLWHLREDKLDGTDEYHEAYCLHYDRWPMGEVPPTPTDTQMLLAGMKTKDEPEDDSAFEVDEIPVLA